MTRDLFNQLVELLGKSVQNGEIKNFLIENGYKYPKRDTITNKSNDDSFWLINKKTGIELLFSISVNNNKYKVENAGRKDTFIPILTNIHFQKSAKAIYPAGVTFASKFDELKEKFGEPAFNEYLEVYKWSFSVDKTRDIVFSITYSKERDEVKKLWLEIEQDWILINLYDKLLWQTSDDIAKQAQTDSSLKSHLFFIRWALENDFLIHEGITENLDKFRAKEIDFMEFIKLSFAECGYLTLKDFINVDHGFLHKYIHNMGQYYIYYKKDFDKAFKNKNQDYTPKNFRTASDFINTRLQEFNEHGFANSIKEL